ncbi:MAG: S9 family peptidase [Elusimicrobia bacterium]|nr:S9 family peptidase [Elusimicrobiota bacterium]
MKTRFLLPLAAILAAGCAGLPPTGFPAGAPAAPSARQVPLVETLHGAAVSDPYRWLEDGAAGEVTKWAGAQDSRTRAALAALPWRAKYAERVERLLEVGALGAAVERKGLLFYTKRLAGQEQAVLVVRGPDGSIKPVVDPNAVSKEGAASLDWWSPSPDGALVAYGVSIGGSEDSVLRLRRVSDGTDLPDTIDRARHASVAWLPDASALYYTRYPAPDTVPAGEERYHRRVFLHKLGDDPAKDVPVWGKGRPKEEWSHVSLSEDGRWLLLTTAEGWSKSELRVLDRRTGRWSDAVVGKESLYEGLIDRGTLYVLTDEGAPHGRLMSAPAAAPARAGWKELVGESRRILESFALTRERLVLLERAGPASLLKTAALDGSDLREAPLPGLGSVAGLSAEPGAARATLRYESPLNPPMVLVLDPATGAATPADALPSPIAPDRFAVSLGRCPSSDGTQVPLVIVRKVGLKGPRPTILTGYGGFNVPVPPVFRPEVFAWLERGGVWAQATLRGGSEFGADWHHAGMLGEKQNVFDDFLACAETLTSEGVARPGQLAAMGGSNGGLLVLAAITQAPEKFGGAVAQVPLADMLRYPRSLIGRLWIPEYGDPEKPEDFAWLKAYSPYHRAAPAAYPGVLITTGASDTRVDPFHARKMAAALQAATTSGRPVLLRVEGKAGHGAGKPASLKAAEWADVFSFLEWQLK